MITLQTTSFLHLVCEDKNSEYFKTPQKIIPELLIQGKYLTLYKFSVNARQWQKVSDTHRWIEVLIPELDDKIIQKGKVMLFMSEFHKNPSLPFKYYQGTKAITFQPSYEKGRIYVTILGDITLSANLNFHFKVMLIKPEALRHFKNMNWFNYEETKGVLKL